MELYDIFKGIIEADIEPVVVCDTDNTIIYMNSTAIKRYEKRGGKALVGRSIMDCHNDESKKKIETVLEWFKQSEDNNRMFTYHSDRNGSDYDVYMIAIRDDSGKLLGYYEKHENRLHEIKQAYDMR